MGDSELSSSELRKRYARGGSMKDDELTAAQLRARHGIPANRDDFAYNGEKSGGSSAVVLIVAVVLIIAAIYFILQNS